MALIDSVLNMVSKTPKDPDAPKPAPGSRSEREAKIKDKAGIKRNKSSSVPRLSLLSNQTMYLATF